MMKVGFIGLGRMGSGVCSNVIKNGYCTTVYDIHESALKKFERKATLADSAEEVF